MEMYFLLDSLRLSLAVIDELCVLDVDEICVCLPPEGVFIAGAGGELKGFGAVFGRGG